MTNLNDALIGGFKKIDEAVVSHIDQIVMRDYELFKICGRLLVELRRLQKFCGGASTVIAEMNVSEIIEKLSGGDNGDGDPQHIRDSLRGTVGQAETDVDGAVADTLERLYARIKLLEANGATVHKPSDPAVRFEVFKITDGCCFYCDTKLSAETMEVDHVIPRSKGGPDNMANFVPSCKPCNMNKSDKHPINFIRQKLGHNVVRLNPNIEAAE